MAAVELEAPGAADLRRQFHEFLDGDAGEGDYVAKVRKMMADKGQRLMVDLNDVREYDAELARRLLETPTDVVPPFEDALKEVVLDLDPAYLEDRDDAAAKLYVGFEGSFGANLVSPRGLTADFITKMVCVEGIATKCSLVRPKVVRSVHYCPTTNKFSRKDYRDATDFGGEPTGSVYPTKDSDGNPLETEFGLCTYKQHQSLSIQEMPERAPLGQLPRSVDCLLDNDLVDKVKPGDRIQIVGIFRALSGSQQHSTSGVFRTVLLANSVRVLGKDVQGITVTPEDARNIRDLSKRKDIFELLARSLAPSIFGHEHIKKAVLLMLLGGREVTLKNGTHLRGDINILMVGDPSTAKSQMLRFVLSIAPLAVNTTGRGSSGVGLTAAVTTDADTGDRRLEAGAMVLADRGVVCIDEFDKMDDKDRVAIHEVMEQQTVTIAKAGIHASLNARCSVVAAANPIYGNYDKTLPPQKNVGLPDSLLSRFDLLFIVLDELSAEHDAAISDHVLRMHCYEKPGQEGLPVPLDEGFVGERDEDADEEEGSAEVFEKFNPLLHGAAGAIRGRRGQREELLSMDFCKKYVHYAKQRSNPVLTDEACELIATEYNNMRQKQDAKTMPVTVRALETLIRLSTAHAKSRLGKKVREDDVSAATGVLNFALYHEAEVTENKRKGRAFGDGSGDERPDDDDDDEDGGDDRGARAGSKRRSRSGSSSHTTPRKGSKPSGGSPAAKRSRRSRSASRSDAADEEESSQEKTQPVDANPLESSVAAVGGAGSGRRSGRSPRSPGSARSSRSRSPERKSPRSARSRRASVDGAGSDTLVSVDRAGAGASRGGSPGGDAELPEVQTSSRAYKTFTRDVAKLFRKKRASALATSEIHRSVGESMTRSELKAMLLAMEAENKVMVRDGIVHVI